MIYKALLSLFVTRSLVIQTWVCALNKAARFPKNDAVQPGKYSHSDCCVYLDQDKMLDLFCDSIFVCLDVVIRISVNGKFLKLTLSL